MSDYINRRAAIDAVNGMPDCPNGYSDTYDKAHIIAVLEDVPSVQTDMSGDMSGTHKPLDCISRQAAIDALHMHLMYRMGTDSNKKRLDEWINNLPSVQPEIIRCKDCKYWMRAYLSISGKHGCNVMRDYTAPDDYCFKAERKA